jgi:hypothetical protein
MEPIDLTLSERIKEIIEFQEFLRVKLLEVCMSEFRIPKERFDNYEKHKI